jgi:hypothetical protein
LQFYDFSFPLPSPLSTLHSAATPTSHTTAMPPRTACDFKPQQRPSFLFFCPFFERFSQICPLRKDFKKWTLRLAPSTMAPRYNGMAPSSLAPRHRRRGHRGIRRGSSWRQGLAPRTHILANPLFLPESFSFSYSFSSGFSFGHFGQPLQSTYWTVKSWILSVDLRELGILSPFLIYFESIW